MKLKNKKIIPVIVFFVFSSFFLIGLTNSVSAQTVSNTWDQYTPLTPLPGTTKGNCVTDKNGIVSNCSTDIQTYIPGVFNLAIGIAGVLAVLMIIIGGVQYITTDAIQDKSDGKERIQNALWGLVLVLVSWILLYTINPKLTVFDLDVDTTTYNEVGTGSSVASDYDGTNQVIGNTQKEETRTINKDGVDYTASVTTTTFHHEGGGKTYEEVEVYTDNKYDTYRTTKKTDESGDVSTVWRVDHMDGGYDYLDKDGNVIPLNFD